jgi:hypothetical protein
MYCERFFGSIENVCRRLRDAIVESRERNKFPQTYLDGVCGYGGVLPRKGLRLPTCAEFESNPEKYITSLVFSLASSPLDLRIDNVLPIALTEQDKIEVAKEMQASVAGASKGAGGPDVLTVSLEDQATVYVISKILNEVDQRETLGK